jgi:hypothetical protein
MRSPCHELNSEYSLPLEQAKLFLHVENNMIWAHEGLTDSKLTLGIDGGGGGREAPPA